jgi:hypothetical protein
VPTVSDPASRECDTCRSRIFENSQPLGGRTPARVQEPSIAHSMRSHESLSYGPFAGIKRWAETAAGCGRNDALTHASGLQCYGLLRLRVAVAGHYPSTQQMEK